LLVDVATYQILGTLIAFFFSAVLSGSITLQLRTQLHSSWAASDWSDGLIRLLFGDATNWGSAKEGYR
jgi:hypothetical protein